MISPTVRKGLSNSAIRHSIGARRTVIVQRFASVSQGRKPAMSSCRTFASAASIPIIDVSEFNSGADNGSRQRIAGEFDHAFSEFGFAVVTGHGASDEVFDDVYLAGKDFFRQPMDEKRKFDLGLGYGYGGYVATMESGGQLTGELNLDKQSDQVESFTCRGLAHLEVGNVASDPVFAQDMSDVPRCDRIPCTLLKPVIRLNSALYPFKQTLTAVAEMCLGVDPGAFGKAFDPTRGGIRFAYYPDLGKEHGENLEGNDRQTTNGRALGYGAHADSGGMVILRLDKENPVGTEVFYNCEWIPVPHVPGGIVLNLGTVLSIMTGGRWRAAIHRAARANRQERLSLVYGAMVPDNALTLECLAAGDCSDSAAADQVTTRRKVAVKEYLDARVRMQRPETDPEDRELVDFVDKMAK